MDIPMVYITLPIFMHIIIGTRIPKTEGGGARLCGTLWCYGKGVIASFLTVISTC